MTCSSEIFEAFFSTVGRHTPHMFRSSVTSTSENDNRCNASISAAVFPQRRTGRFESLALEKIVPGSDIQVIAANTLILAGMTSLQSEEIKFPENAARSLEVGWIVTCSLEQAKSGWQIIESTWKASRLQHKCADAPALFTRSGQGKLRNLLDFANIRDFGEFVLS